jgi:hypothetical protein
MLCGVEKRKVNCLISPGDRVNRLLPDKENTGQRENIMIVSMVIASIDALVIVIVEFASSIVWIEPKSILSDERMILHGNSFN